MATNFVESYNSLEISSADLIKQVRKVDYVTLTVCLAKARKRIHLERRCAAEDGTAERR